RQADTEIQHVADSTWIYAAFDLARLQQRIDSRGYQQHTLMLVVHQTLHTEAVDGCNQFPVAAVPENHRKPALQFLYESRAETLVERRQQRRGCDVIGNFFVQSNEVAQFIQIVKIGIARQQDPPVAIDLLHGKLGADTNPTVLLDLSLHSIRCFERKAD